MENYTGIIREVEDIKPVNITAKGVYALKALLDLSHRYGNGEVVPLSDIAGRWQMPLKFLEQVMLILKKAGFVESRRGIGGGFLLKKPPDSITVGQIIRLVDGTFDIFPQDKMAEGDHPFGKYEERAIQELREQVVKAIGDIVESATLSDLIHRAEELHSKNTGYMYQI